MISLKREIALNYKGITMDKYIAKRDCYCQGHFLKKGEEMQVPKGTKIDFTLVEKVAPVEVTDPKKQKA